MSSVSANLNYSHSSTVFPQMTEHIWPGGVNEFKMKADNSVSDLQSVFHNVSTLSSLNRSTTSAVLALAHSVSSGTALLTATATSGPARGELLNSLDSTEVYLVDEASAGAQTLVLCENLRDNPQSKFSFNFLNSLILIINFVKQFL